MTEQKPKYNSYQSHESENYLPEHYKGYTDSFYEKEDSSFGSFIVGAIMGGVVGAATALFLAPKTGKEMREDLSTQAGQWKDKGIEISTVAKGKASEFTAVAKEKSDEVAKTIQEQSGQLVDKVKTMASKTKVPMDDGTVSIDGEEATEYVEKAKDKVKLAVEKAKDKVEDFADKIEDKAEDVKDRAEDKADAVKDKLEDKYKDVKDKLD